MRNFHSMKIHLWCIRITKPSNDDEIVWWRSLIPLPRYRLYRSVLRMLRACDVVLLSWYALTPLCDNIERYVVPRCCKYWFRLDADLMRRFKCGHRNRRSGTFGSVSFKERFLVLLVSAIAASSVPRVAALPGGPSLCLYTQDDSKPFPYPYDQHRWFKYIANEAARLPPPLYVKVIHADDATAKVGSAWFSKPPHWRNFPKKCCVDASRSMGGIRISVILSLLGLVENVFYVE